MEGDSDVGVALDSEDLEKREVGNDAVWSLSSTKPGNGVEQIRDNNMDTFWQSDGGQPHLINIQFQKKMSLCEVSFYLDYQLDESYTPMCLSVRAGNTFHDLVEIETLDVNEPHGWVRIPLFDINGHGKQVLRAFFLQICVVSMHQNGRDTHVRQVKIYSPRASVSGSVNALTAPEFHQFGELR